MFSFFIRSLNLKKKKKTETSAVVDVCHIVANVECWSYYEDPCKFIEFNLSFIGPIPWGHSGPLHHALSLSSSMSWTSHDACAIAIAGVRLATPGD